MNEKIIDLATSTAGGFALTSIPEVTSDWDEVYMAVMEARELNKAVAVYVPRDRSPSSYRQNIVSAMRGRGIGVNTACSTDFIHVWYRADLVEIGGQK